MFGIRGIFKNEVLIKGLFFSENKETIPDECLVECSGFILSQGLLKKDHNLVLCSDVPDNIAYYAGGNLPICIAGEDNSEVDPEDQEDPPDPEGDVGLHVIEDDPDDPRNSNLRWGTIYESIDQGRQYMFYCLGYLGNTSWTVHTSPSTFYGNVEVNFNPNSPKYGFVTPSWFASGSFVVSVSDAFNTITTSVSINDMEWFQEPPDDDIDPGDFFEMSVKNSHPFLTHTYPDWYIDSTEFEQDDDDPESKAVNGVYIVGITDKDMVSGYVVNKAIVMTTEGECAVVTIKCQDDYTTLEKEITVYSPPNCDGNPSIVAQGTSVELEVIGGLPSINWSLSHIGTSLGFSLTPDPEDERKATLSASANARGSVLITVEDSFSNSCTITVNTTEGENIIPVNISLWESEPNYSCWGYLEAQIKAYQANGYEDITISIYSSVAEMLSAYSDILSYYSSVWSTCFMQSGIYGDAREVKNPGAYGVGYDCRPKWIRYLLYCSSPVGEEIFGAW